LLFFNMLVNIIPHVLRRLNASVDCNEGSHCVVYSFAHHAAGCPADCAAGLWLAIPVCCLSYFSDSSLQDAVARLHCRSSFHRSCEQLAWAGCIVEMAGERTAL
jgi:hypothetical protein